MLVQTSPKGSYRVEQLLEYFDKLLPVAERPEDSVCLYLDWFSAHLSPEVWELVVEEKGHMLMFHGGGTTGVMQSNDTHIHEPLSKLFKKWEMDDVVRQRRQNPRKIPRRTRQAVYNDCDAAWELLDHNYLGPKAQKQTGMTLDLEGAEDDDIYHDLKPLWFSTALDMPSARAKCIQEVTDEFMSGRITSFSQWPEILEQYPAHPPTREGQECLPTRYGDDDDDNDDDGSEGEGDDDDDDDDMGGGAGAAGGCADKEISSIQFN